MLHELFKWVQESLGANYDAGVESWAQQFRGSLNLWGLTEGTHVLTLMVFAGTIWLVDMRMLGVAFRTMPFSRLNQKILPFTVISFAVMIVTGILLFLAKPMDYYHSIWFRLKMVFLLLAAANIFWFHHHVQKTEAEWDDIREPVPASARTLPTIMLVVSAIVFFAGGTSIIAATISKSLSPLNWLAFIVGIAMLAGTFWYHHKTQPEPPLPVKLSGAFSLMAWIIIIIFGRFIAYNWFDCGKPLPGFLNWAAECSTWPGGIVEAIEVDVTETEISEPVEATLPELPEDVAPDGAAGDETPASEGGQ
ncbi:MAG: hypothetical protein R3C52_08370 [Hyphomonadaceae bacterium]